MMPRAKREARDIVLVPVTPGQLDLILSRVGFLLHAPHTTPTSRLVCEAYLQGLLDGETVTRMNRRRPRVTPSHETTYLTITKL